MQVYSSWRIGINIPKARFVAVVIVGIVGMMREESAGSRKAFVCYPVLASVHRQEVTRN